MKSFKVVTAGLGVVVLWASAFPAIQVAAPGLGVIGLSFVRMVVAAGALLVVAPFFRVRLPERRQLPLLVVAAFFGMTAYQVLLNWGELAVPAGTASIIVAAAPLVSVAIATRALGERLTVAKVMGSAVAISGVAWVCLARSGATASTGLWIVVGAMLVQGVYHPLTKALLRHRTGLEVATYAMVAGTVMTLPMLPWGWHDLMAGPAPAWGAAIYLGLLPSALGFVLWGYTVARLPVTTSTSLLYLVPAVAVLIAFVWLGELPYPSELLGGLVVLAGVLVISQGDHIRQRLAGHAADSPESDVTPSVAPTHKGRSQAHALTRERIEGARGEADDRTGAGLMPSDRLSPGHGACDLQQREALVVQLVRSDVDGVNVTVDAKMSAVTGAGLSSIGTWSHPGSVVRWVPAGS